MISSSRITTCFLFLILSGMVVFGRPGTRLYSIGNNVPWNQAASWSLNPGGNPSGLIPQSTDSLYVNSSLILNIDFTLAGAGQIIVSPSGLIRGNAFKLSLNDNSYIYCEGEVQINQLDVNDNSAFNVTSRGRVSVANSLVNLSVTPSLVAGNLIISGMLDCGGASSDLSSIQGNGRISGASFSGAGSLMSMHPASSVPANSVVSEINWIGPISSDWNNPMNWSGNEVPTSTSNIAILTGAYLPVLSENGFCNDLSLSPGTQLVLLPSSMLQIDHDLSIPESSELSLNNSVTGKASLILLGEVTGKIRSEFQVTDNSSLFVSSPVADALSGVFVNMYLREYDESSSSWGNYIVPTDVELKPMQGYELFSPYSATRIFEGKPNTGEIIQPISSTNDGWNLIGNPYPCFLDWQSNDLTGLGWERNSIAKAIYYPDPSGSGNFSVFVPGDNSISVNNGSRYIPPMQGFFVKAKQEGTVKVNRQAIATVTDQSTIRMASSALKFRIESNGTSDESVVRFEPASSFNFDDDFDAYKLPGTGTAPSIFTTGQDGTKMAVNTMPSLSSSLNIPIGISCTEEKTYKLTVDGAFNFEYRYPLTLEDRATHTFVNLRADSAYSFVHSPGMDPMRFVLHFDIVAGIDMEAAGQPQITLSDGNIRITSTGDQKCNVEIYTMDGKQLLQTSGSLMTELRIPFQGNHGIYLVKVTTKTTCYARKLYAE